tara:strand:- start:111 stop:551 length:441 start_codon:yes stop_codon:yes gene_type:complete
MIITPVSQSKKSPPRRDYEEQVERRKVGMTHMWDDSKSCHAVEGDLFAFIENSVKISPKSDAKTDGKIEIFRINAIHSPDERLPTWSNNVGQTDRNVVELSDTPLYEGTMIEWRSYMGYKETFKVQGTMNIDGQKLRKYIHDKITH